MRRLASIMVIGLGLAACGGPAPSGSSADLGGDQDPDAKVLAEVDSRTPYTGAWAPATSLCGSEKDRWTIEPARMAAPQLRFCAFEDMVVNDVEDRTTRFATAANCLAEGRQTRDFVFFRLSRNLREMRVTFNDTDGVKLVRCPLAS